MCDVTFGEGKNAFRLNDVKVGDGFMKNMGKNLIDGVARATVNSAITGTDLQTNIRTNVVASILGAAQAQGADWIGNQTLLGGAFNTNGNVNEFAHEFAHAIVGCAAGAAGARAAGSGTSTGQGCGAGALGAVVGELSAQFYGGTDPGKAVAFAQMMSGIAAAATGLDSEGVAMAANTGANAAQNNYMAHYDTYEADLKACQQNPGGVNCGAILSLTKGTNTHYLGMTQGGYRVAANRGKDGADSSYTVVSPSGETMVMQPTEWAYFSQMTSGQQATIFAGSQWQLDLTSATEYGLSGNTTAAMANYAHMLTQPDYWVGMGAAFLPAGVLGRAKVALGDADTLAPEIKRLAEANITDSGETVLGHFPGYITKANTKGASYFDIGSAWNDLTPEQRWAANTHFLDKIASKGDTVNLSLPKGEIRSGSYLSKEINYLTSQKGYKWVNQWSLRSPGGK